MHNQLAVTVVIGSCLTAATILWAGSYPSGGLIAGLAAVILAGIGTYRISACWTSGTGTYFSERDGGFLNGVGFAYLPDGPRDDPSMVGSVTYSQLRGSWYWYIQEW